MIEVLTTILLMFVGGLVILALVGRAMRDL
jgi:hypothetical protein